MGSAGFIYFHQHRLAQLFPVNNLDRHLLAEHAVDPELDQPRLAFAERPLEPVRADVLVPLGSRARTARGGILLLHLATHLAAGSATTLRLLRQLVRESARVVPQHRGGVGVCFPSNCFLAYNEQAHGHNNLSL